jgi:hypothetical protein
MKGFRQPIITPGGAGRDEGTLAELGYKQELRRDWGLLHNFGVSFSIISVIGEARTTSIAMNYFAN